MNRFLRWNGESPVRRVSCQRANRRDDPLFSKVKCPRPSAGRGGSDPDLWDGRAVCQNWPFVFTFRISPFESECD